MPSAMNTTVCRMHPDPDEETEARLSELSDEIDALRERDTLWLPETLAVAGAVVCIDEDGEIDVRRGLVSPADSAADANVGDDDDGADEADADDVAAAGQPALQLGRKPDHAPDSGAWRSVVAESITGLLSAVITGFPSAPTLCTLIGATSLAVS
jgi:hypothetical protein